MEKINKEKFYENIAGNFDQIMNKYDLEKRLNIVFKTLLGDISGKTLLDAGCGTGWFSKTAVEKGAIVTSLDVGKGLLEETRKKCAGKCKTVVGDAQMLPFNDNDFDIVLSTEVIEHTKDPEKAIKEAMRVLKKGGLLVLTTPNKIWHPAITIANKLKLRPYEGLENWLSCGELKQTITKDGLTIKQVFGFNVIPFIHPITYPVITYLDRFGRQLQNYMLNIAFLAQK